MTTDTHATHLDVVCNAGYKGDERPIRFRLGTTHYLVEEILDRWYGPDDAYFKVSVAHGDLYTLRRSLAQASPEGVWTLEGHRPGRRERGIGNLLSPPGVLRLNHC